MTVPQKPLIFIATPCFGGLVSQHYMQSVLALMQYSGAAGFDAALGLLGHDSLITRSRNTLITQFLGMEQATHLMFIDADIAFAPEHVHAMLAYDQDVVGGMYPVKVINWDQIALKRLTAGEKFETAPLLYVGTLCTGDELDRRGRFATGIYCGTGFMLVKREAILRMAEAYPETKYKSVHAYSNAKGDENYALFDCFIDKKTGIYLSEDYGFCERWRALGGKIWLDTEGKLTHIGAYNFPGNPEPRFRPAEPIALSRAAG